MSVLEGKNIVVVGDETAQIKEIETMLTLKRVNVINFFCNDVTVSDLIRHNVDAIIINHLHDDSPCNTLFTELRNTRFMKEVPIFALVNGAQNEIRDVLMMGAADYFTPDESAASVVKKMRVLLGESDNLSSSSLLEVPEDILPFSVKTRKVFIVEDDSLLRNLLASKLSASSLPFDFAVSGEDAIDKIRAYKPNIIILDLMLPVRDGFEVLAELKADASLRGIPIIIFSNKDSEEDKKKAFALGADRYYVKAMTDLSTLISAMDELS